MTLTSSLLRLSAHHLARTALALQPLKSGTLSTHLSVPVPVLIPSVVTPRPTTASRPSRPLNPSPLAPQIRLLLTTVHADKQYLFTYLLTARICCCTACCGAAAAGRRPASRAAIDRHLLPAGPTAANMQQWRAASDGTDRQTDRQTDRHPTVAQTLLCILCGQCMPTKKK